MKNAILIHGMNKAPDDVWYPWLCNELAAAGIKCVAPSMPPARPLVINEWMDTIDSLNPNEDTILVGHSRGGMAILRWLETRHIKVAKVVLIATNSATIIDQAGGDFYSGPYNFDAIKQHCPSFLVLHSKDDEWVPYQAAIENTTGLDAQLISFEDRNHFGRQADGSEMMTFPEAAHAAIA